MLGSHLFWAAWMAQSGRPGAGAAALLRSRPRALSMSGMERSMAHRGCTRPGLADSSPTASRRLLISVLLSRGRQIQRRSSLCPPAAHISACQVLFG